MYWGHSVTLSIWQLLRLKTDLRKSYFIPPQIITQRTKSATEENNFCIVEIHFNGAVQSSSLPSPLQDHLTKQKPKLETFSL